MEDIDKLYRSEVPEIVQALEKQLLVQRHSELREHWAFLASIITNGFLGIATGLSGKRGKAKTVTPEDFINKDFQKYIQELFSEQEFELQWNSHIEDAKAKGIQGPW